MKDLIKKFNNVYVRYIDTTHVMVSNNQTDADDHKGGVYHIAQLRDEPYYNDMINWMGK